MKVTVRNFPRLDEEGIKDMARGIVRGTRYVHHGRELPRCALWLTMGSITFSDAAAQKVGAIVGSMDRVQRTCNGQPMTYAGWIVHVDDWVQVCERIKRIEAAMNE